MATCVTCSTSFHACYSCGLSYWEWEYCCSKCAMKDVYKHKKQLDALVRFWTAEQLAYFRDFLYDLQYGDSDLSELPDMVPGLGKGSAMELELEDGNLPNYLVLFYIEARLRALQPVKYKNSKQLEVVDGLADPYYMPL